MLARIAFVGIVMSAVIVAGCSSAPPNRAASRATSSPTPTGVYDQQRAAGVARTLVDLSAAITAGDTARIDGLLDASADADFRGSLHTAAANLSAKTAADRRVDPPVYVENPSGSSESSAGAAGPVARGTGLRLKRFAYQVAPTEEAELLVPGPIQQRLDAEGSSDSWVAPVELHYALGGATTPGVDEPEVTVDAQMVLARFDDSWRIVGDASLVDSSPVPTLLWDLPGAAARDVATVGGTSVVVSYPGTGATSTRVAGLLPGAIDAVSDFWGTGWARRTVVVATATNNDFASLAASSGSSVADAAAAAVFDRIDTVNHAAVGQRVLLTPSAADLATPVLAEVMRHELTHIATRGVTSPGAPLWITEGVPEYVGRKDTYVRFADAAPALADRVLAGQVPADLPSDRDFSVDSASAQLAYQTGWSVAAYVAGHYGQATLKKLYLGVAATADTAQQNAAISSVLGVDRARLVTDWQRWLREQVR